MSIVRSSAKALIVKENTFLIVEEEIDGGKEFDIPGGGIEYMETPLEAVKREVFEELGVEIEVEKLAGVFWFLSTINKKWVICSTFLCRLTDEKAQFSLENNPADNENITATHWVTKEEVLSGKYRITESFIQMLQQVEWGK